MAAKQIVITYNDRDYTLEFNRRVVRNMEASGFVVDTNKPASMITDLFRGAFQMHHRKISPELVEEIWDAQRGKDKLLTELIAMYTEPIAALMDEDEGEEDANPTWKVV
jgi:hypothetical protein